MTLTWSDVNIDVGPWEYGERKKLCPQCSHTRRHNSRERCLSVNVTTGQYNCHHCGWQGNLGYEQRDWRDRIVTPQKQYAVPEPVEDMQLEQWGIDWLAKRGISEATAQALGIYTDTHYFPQLEKEDRALVFPYVKDGITVNHKYRGRNKSFANDKDCEHPFYNFDALVDATDIYIVEGEMDVAAFYEAGLTEVISVPNGASDRKMEYLDAATEYLQSVATVTLAVDMDTVGRQLQEELARRLGRERCKVVTWPEEMKDANDVLVKLGPDALRMAVAEARYFPVGGSVHFADLRDELYRSFHFKPSKGFSTGWETLDNYYTVRPGELTIITGIPGHGKSEWLSSLLVNLVKEHNFSFSIFSPENYDDTPAPLAEQLIRKWVGKPFKPQYDGHMEWQEIDSAINIFEEHFAFINPEEPHLDDILETASVHLRRLGIKGLVLDPWNEIAHERSGMTETEYIGEALRRIRKFARKHDIAVWVVAHPTKMQKTVMEDGTQAFEVPSAYSISGSANWYNKADNILSVYRFPQRRELPTQVHIQKIRKQPDVGKPGMVEFTYEWRTASYADVPQEFPDANAA